jgi:FSR family fosmidomycin resistance protein-like MFS transporter
VASLVLFFKLRTICKQHIGKFHKQSRMPLGKTLRSIAPFFGIVTPIMLFRAFSKTALTTFLPAYMVAGGHSMGSAAAALALLELAGAGGALLSGSLSDRMGRKTILLVIMLTSPVLMFGFTCVAGMGQWILLGLMGVTFFASTPVFLAMVQDLKSDRPSFLNGLFMTLSFAASSIVALLVGVFADHVGFVATYRIAAAMSLCAIPFTLFLRDE